MYKILAGGLQRGGCVSRNGSIRRGSLTPRVGTPLGGPGGSTFALLGEGIEFQGGKLLTMAKEEIARGAFGTVYKVPWLTQESEKVVRKWVALKSENAGVQNPQLDREASVLERLQALKSPYFPEYYGCVEFEGQSHLAMEWVGGKTLRDVMKHLFAIETLLVASQIEFVKEIICQLIEAIRVIHSIDLIHRDLKPENIMLTPEGVVKIIDWGSRGDTWLMANDIPGTPGYTDSERAKEMLKGLHLDASPPKIPKAKPGNDLHAIGLIWYELMSNLRPFEDPYQQWEAPSDAYQAAIDNEKPLISLENLFGLWEYKSEIIGQATLADNLINRLLDKENPISATEALDDLVFKNTITREAYQAIWEVLNPSKAPP